MICFMAQTKLLSLVEAQNTRGRVYNIMARCLNMFYFAQFNAKERGATVIALQ